MTLYLVDTSVWVSYMRDEETEVTKRFVEIGERGHPFGITGVIHQEVLQGAASQIKFDYLAEFMGSQTALIYFRCRRAGITIRSTIDCLIARVAIEYDLLLLHDDRDFEDMAGVISELTLA